MYWTWTSVHDGVREATSRTANLLHKRVNFLWNWSCGFIYQTCIQTKTKALCGCKVRFSVSSANEQPTDYILKDEYLILRTSSEHFFLSVFTTNFTCRLILFSFTKTILSFSSCTCFQLIKGFYCEGVLVLKWILLHLLSSICLWICVSGCWNCMQWAQCIYYLEGKFSWRSRSDGTERAPEVDGGGKRAGSQQDRSLEG